MFVLLLTIVISTYVWMENCNINMQNNNWNKVKQIIQLMELFIIISQLIYNIFIVGFMPTVTTPLIWDMLL